VVSKIYACADVTERKFGTTNNTQLVPGAGANSYTWSIAPTSFVQFNSGTTVLNFSATISSSTTVSQYTVTLRAKNASGTTSVTQTIDIDYCVGLSESILQNALGVFPNPAHDVVTVKVNNSKGFSLKVTNVLGSVVVDKTSQQESVNLDLSAQPRGVYFLTVVSNGEKATRKIIVE